MKDFFTDEEADDYRERGDEPQPYPPKQDTKCAVCRSVGTMRIDAYVEWSVEKHDWVINNVFTETAICDSCGAENQWFWCVPNG